jgi:hypothetical protein
MGLQRELQYAMPTTLDHNGGIGPEFFILRKGYIKIYRESFDHSSPFLEDVNGVNLVHIVNESQVLTEEQVHSPKMQINQLAMLKYNRLRIRTGFSGFGSF